MQEQKIVRLRLTSGFYLLLVQVGRLRKYCPPSQARRRSMPHNSE
jgi:hypothetical protein